MIGIGTKVMILDNSGGRIGLCIKVLRKFRHMYGYVGDILILTIRRYRRAIHRKYRRVKIGEICCGMLITSRKERTRKIGNTVVFNTNGIILLTRELVPLGRRMHSGMFFDIRFKGYFRVALMAKGLF